jgi:hypothetical protein
MTKPKEIPLPECQAFVNARKLPALFLFLSEVLEKKHVLRIRNLLQDKRYEQLDLVIQSGGGNIHSAYQIIEILRLHANKLNACVPFWAKSAATLLCVGCDLIILDELSELGPLDTQIAEEKKGGKVEFTSALNPFKTLEQLQKFSIETLDMGVRTVQIRSGLDLDDCIKHAIDFVGATTGPLFNKLDPEKLGEYSRALKVGADYAERLARRYKNWDDKKRGQVISKLVYEYPSHDYIIDYHELNDIGFEATLFEGEEVQACKQLFDLILKRSNIIEMFEPIANPSAGETSEANAPSPQL